jgi:hypothetical protein
MTSQRGVPRVAYRSWNFMNNLGDIITPNIIDGCLGAEPVFGTLNSPHLLAIGSIMFMANRYSHIWGSGVLNPADKVPAIEPKQVHALRGHKTLAVLRAQGIDVGEVPLGDPGFFARDLLEQGVIPTLPTKYRACIIPHHDSIWKPKADWRKFFSRIEESDEFCIVNMLDNSLQPLELIQQSEIVVSQGLHGLIFAAALGKRSVWVSERFDETWKFKFEDWFSTVRNAPKEPLWVGEDVELLLSAASRQESMIDRQALRDSFPRDHVSVANTRRLNGYAACRRHNPFFLMADSLRPYQSRRIDVMPQAEKIEIEDTLFKLTSSVFSNWSERPFTYVSLGHTHLNLEAVADLVKLVNTFLDHDCFIVHDLDDLRLMPWAEPKWYSTPNLVVTDSAVRMGAGFMLRPSHNFTWNSRVGHVFMPL